MNGGEEVSERCACDIRAEHLRNTLLTWVVHHLHLRKTIMERVSRGGNYDAHAPQPLRETLNGSNWVPVKPVKPVFLHSPPLALRKRGTHLT